MVFGGQNWLVQRSATSIRKHRRSPCQRSRQRTRWNVSWTLIPMVKFIGCSYDSQKVVAQTPHYSRGTEDPSKTIAENGRGKRQTSRVGQARMAASQSMICAGAQSPI